MIKGVRSSIIYRSELSGFSDILQLALVAQSFLVFSDHHIFEDH